MSQSIRWCSSQGTAVDVKALHAKLAVTVAVSQLQLTSRIETLSGDLERTPGVNGFQVDSKQVGASALKMA